MKTEKITLTEVRKKMLNNAGVSFEYYPAEQTNDGKCRWVHLGSNPSRSFKTYPAFEKFLKRIGKVV